MAKRDWHKANERRKLHDNRDPATVPLRPMLPMLLKWPARCQLCNERIPQGTRARPVPLPDGRKGFVHVHHS